MSISGFATKACQELNTDEIFDMKCFTTLIAHTRRRGVFNGCVLMDDVIYGALAILVF